MTYTAIDGDISDFIDSMIEVTDDFSTAELRAYLLNEGHKDADVVVGIRIWQGSRFRQINGSWERFALTEAGRSAVEELRYRV